jgi:adenylate cyclase
VFSDEGQSVAGLRANFCKGCLQKMHVPIPIRGLASIPFRAFGIRPSRMNPNCCTICELMFTKVMKARQVSVDATILFADLRGYTSHSQSRPTGAVNAVLDEFYDECAEAIWAHDGLLNKTMGDAVMAIFNFPIGRADHPEQAVLAARDIQSRWKERRESLRRAGDLEGESLGIGIGIDSGEISFGEIGRAHADLTAIGTIVNRAARAQAAAGSDEILLTDAARGRALARLPDSRAGEHRLKGFDEPITLWAA